MADVPEPRVGQVVEHQFLWFEEAVAGQIEGRKARPCLIVAVEPRPVSDPPRVTVLPITSRKPDATSTTIAVPDPLKEVMGLDRARDAWVVIDDANTFLWPGFDLVPQTGGGFVRGAVTRAFFKHVRETVEAVRSRGRPRRIDRD
jgi:hypothetical protein